MDRPRVCLDLDCKPLCSDIKQQGEDSGYSFTCFGKLSIPNEVNWRGVNHRNDFSICICSPFKGITRFLVCKEDIEHWVQLWQEALSYIKK